MKASLRNYRQSPRKVRLVANLVKGKTVEAALAELGFLPKRAGLPIAKLIRSAAANLPAGRQVRANWADLIISDIRVDAGATLKRMRPRARGSGAQIKKRVSHIELTLAAKK